MFLERPFLMAGVFKIRTVSMTALSEEGVILLRKVTVDDLDLKGKRVLMRVDFNVPLNERGDLTDETRITATLPTIRKVLDEGGKLVLMSHLGRPGGQVVGSMSLAPVAKRLGDLLGFRVRLLPDCVGPRVEAMVNAMDEGGCVLLENLRFHPEEEANDPGFSEQLAKLGDEYVNDAFGTAHRAHASTEGVTKFFSIRAAGYLMAKEVEYLSGVISNPDRPFMALLGGAKVSGKVDVLMNLLDKVNVLLIGGGMAYTFLKGQGIEIGRSLLEEDRIPLTREILEKAAQSGVEVLLPVDCVVAERISDDAETKTVDKDQIPKNWEGLDIGPKTVDRFKEKIQEAQTVLWNGPMGVFEISRFAAGTNAIARALAGAVGQGATVVVGGGDTAAAVAKAGSEDRMTHISTGGGASLELLEGKTLPGVTALTDKS